jgi:hypothetical protein
MAIDGGRSGDGTWAQPVVQRVRKRDVALTKAAINQESKPHNTGHFVPMVAIILVHGSAEVTFPLQF